jgi:hypothetical protein
MYLAKTSKQDVLIPVRGPAGFDFTPYPIQVALIPDDGSEPADTDWVSVTWDSNGVARYPVAKNQFTDSSLFAWVTFATGSEAPVIPSGRIRVGNGGS